MTSGRRHAPQLQTIEELHTLLTEHGIDYWLFGGWAVDFHAGRMTRDHDDVDVAIWSADLDSVGALLQARGWVHVPVPGDDGYTAYQRESTRLELALLARDEAGGVYTPLVQGRGDWPAGSFGNDRGEVDGVRARVVSLTSLIEDKSRSHPGRAGVKDRADVAVLTSPRRGG